MVKDREARLNDVFHALSDPTRRAILRSLTRGERTVGELAAPFDMSLAAVSKHLKLLEQAGLMTMVGVEDRSPKYRQARVA